MTSGAAIRKGLGLARRTRPAVWVLFLVNLGLAALAALPIYNGVLRFTGYSLMSRTLRYGFSTDWLADFQFNSPGSLDRYATMILLFGLLSIPVNAVLAGGVLAQFVSADAKFSLGDFIRDARRFAWRLIRLMMIGLVCYWIIFRVLNQSLDGGVGKWTREWISDRSVFAVHLAVGLAIFLCLGFVNLVMDFARVRLVMEDGSSAVEAFLASLGFSLRHLRRALMVYVIPSLGGLALLAVYRLVGRLLPIQNPAAEDKSLREPLTLALLFLWQQAAVLGRYWFRVATWASEWSLYSDSH